MKIVRVLLQLIVIAGVIASAVCVWFSFVEGNSAVQQIAFLALGAVASISTYTFARSVTAILDVVASPAAAKPAPIAPPSPEALRSTYAPLRFPARFRRLVRSPDGRKNARSRQRPRLVLGRLCRHRCGG
jgi:hypothetical protein